MNEDQVIAKIQSLKKIKPNAEWASFLKKEILMSNSAKPQEASFLSVFNGSFAKSLSYAFAAMMLVVFGSFGLQVVPNSPAEQNTASIMTVKDIALIEKRIEELKIKSVALAQISKENPEEVAVAVDEVKKAAKNLTDVVLKNPKEAKGIALELTKNKTLLSLDGGDELKNTSDMLYKTIDEQMLKDLKDIVLTEDQKISFEKAEELYNAGEYSKALEEILLINVKNEE